MAFLDLLGEVTFELGWEVHAWALMPNHFHLLVRSVEGNLSRCMQTLCGRYTRRLNVQEGGMGRRFAGAFGTSALWTLAICATWSHTFI
ncbi:MAG: transposase [Myxococcota bacterium]